MNNLVLKNLTLREAKAFAKVYSLRPDVLRLKAELKKAGVSLAQYHRAECINFGSAIRNRIATRYMNAAYKLALACTKLAKV
jgi:hypothetical protein